ncbi:sensor domain-containing diguanylate cyclase [Jeotgalibacillus terrae]|uniref:Diguanylate cyclase n=1 Tax=Jeotgalibacillus terrae TaxID=587735 RepID=A0ABW5ZFH5_9BACL|nr:sensor domain-containing diguanylate cyclase [Jeotgalibacillus terrae]MBM7579349.1 sigma-B regulation protein RsbU (phosphoserine phosphatase) [Jeotgalibacillus terrae]
MDTQLYYAPCGFIITEPDGRIIEANEMISKIIGEKSSELKQRHITSLLTVPSKLYFQTYFSPVISLYKKVEEMYLTLETSEGPVPVLMNAQERDEQFEYVFVKMKTRDDFENGLITAKRQVEKILEDTDYANGELQKLLAELESKREEITEANSRLENLAMIDPLTSVRNRRYYEEVLTHFLKKSEEENFDFSYLILDIDHFKKVNDEFGHPVGDQVLQDLAWKLEGEIRSDDVLIRFGGEEFVILLSGIQDKLAVKIADRIRENIEISEWPHSPITISIGVSGAQKMDTKDSIFKRADEALYYSKKNGRNQVTLR